MNESQAKQLRAYVNGGGTLVACGHPGALADMLAFTLDQGTSIHSILVVRHGRLVLEAYGPQYGPETPCQVNDVANVVVSLKAPPGKYFLVKDEDKNLSGKKVMKSICKEAGRRFVDKP